MWLRVPGSIGELIEFRFLGGELVGGLGPGFVQFFEYFLIPVVVAHGLGCVTGFEKIGICHLGFELLLSRFQFGDFRLQFLAAFLERAEYLDHGGS